MSLTIKKKMLILLCVLFARSLLAQEEMPVIVDQPQTAETVFTNWKPIELIYTVRWLDGYEILWDNAEPENMSFGQFQLDPVRGYKLEKRNQRKYKEENYVDLVYHLRHVGEKKGDAPIPEQIFYYVKTEPGKSLANLERREVKVAGRLLRYDSTLPKDATDIMDQIDFGSYKQEGYLWKGLAVGLVMIYGATLYFVFRKPSAIAARKLKQLQTKITDRESGDSEERLIPKEALKVFDNQLASLQVALTSNSVGIRQASATTYNEIHRLLLSLEPEFSSSDSISEMRAKLGRLPKNRFRQLLVDFLNRMEIYDRNLYGHVDYDAGALFFQIGSIRKLVVAHTSWRIRLIAWLKKPIRGGR